MPNIDPSRVNPDLIRSKQVAIVGYGNQGRAQALNLRDNGVKVLVGLYAGSRSWAVAIQDGQEVSIASQAVSDADVVMMCTPDMKMAEAFSSAVEPHLKPGTALLFSHGFNVHYGLIPPPKGVDVALVSPKGAGHGVRQRFLEGSGVPGLVAVRQDFSGLAMDLALSYAWGIGCRADMIFETTFREETESDLFGEQAVLCGGIPELMKAAFDTLVNAGVSPEVAYFECVHEAKIIVDLIVERGIAGMRDAISDTAQWGGLIAGPRVVDDHVRGAMQSLWDDICNERFARRWIGESASGQRELRALKEQEKELPLEEVGRGIRERLAGPHV